MLVRVAIAGAALLLALLAWGAWLVVQPEAGPFVVAGAADVRVAETELGRRQITYVMTRPDDGWQTMVVRGLRRAGWEHKRGDPWGDTEDFVPTYVRTTRVWFVRVQEEAQILGSRELALIRLERRLSLQW